MVVGTEFEAVSTVKAEVLTLEVATEAVAGVLVHGQTS